jgi:hypothetical protein
MKNNTFSLEVLYEELRTCNSYDSILEMKSLKDLEQFVSRLDIEDVTMAAKAQTWLITLLSYGVFHAESIDVDLCKRYINDNVIKKLFLLSEEIFNTSVTLSETSEYGKRFSKNTQFIKIDLHELLRLANSAQFNEFLKVLQIVSDIHPSITVDNYIDVVLAYLFAYANEHTSGMLLIDLLNEIQDIDDDIVRYMLTIIQENFNSPQSEALDNLYKHFDIFCILAYTLGNEQIDLPMFYDIIDYMNIAFKEPETTRAALFFKIMKGIK